MNRHLQKLMKDYKDIQTNPLTNIKVACEENNLHNWYCMIHGLTDEEYVGGEFIFNIKLAANHPMSPPDFYFLTPNGRFDVNKKLCFTNSSYHSESWSPVWNLQTIILGFLSFFLEKQSSGIGHLVTTSENKKQLAENSKKYNVDKLNNILELFTK